MAESEQGSIQEKLVEAVERFKTKALAYYLGFEAAERKLPQEVKNGLKEQYGKEKFMPAMEWKTFFGEEMEDSDALDTAIMSYLKEVNYSKEAFVMPKDRIKNMLWNNIRQQGKSILDKAVEQA